MIHNRRFVCRSTHKWPILLHGSISSDPPHIHTYSQICSDHYGISLASKRNRELHIFFALTRNAISTFSDPQMSMSVS